MQIGEQTFDVARTAVLSAGWPESRPGHHRRPPVRQLAAGRALRRRRRRVSGQYDVAVAGGVEVMSRTPMGVELHREPARRRLRRPLRPATSRTRASAPRSSPTSGASPASSSTSTPCAPTSARTPRRSPARFDAQIAPVTNPEGVVVSKDEGIRAGGTMEKLATLKPAFKEDGKITAANSSQISDGSAALLIMTSEKAQALGLTPARAHPHRRARRRRPHADAARADARHARRRSQKSGLVGERHRRVRGERGVRLRAARLAQGHRRRRQDGEPERRRHRPRATRWAVPARAS